MSLSNSLKKNTRSVAPNLNNIRIHRSQPQTTVPMLNEKVAPAGVYISKIAAVTASKIQTTEADAVDITYELTGDDGRIVQGRIRYEVGGYHLAKLLEALAEAGVPDGTPITNAVGTMEKIEIMYPYRGSLAKIVSRCPVEAPAEPEQKPKAQPKAKLKAPAVDVSEDDEFDDFLEDDEDDDF